MSFFCFTSNNMTKPFKKLFAQINIKTEKVLENNFFKKFLKKNSQNYQNIIRIFNKSMSCSNICIEILVIFKNNWSKKIFLEKKFLKYFFSVLY